MFFVFDLTILLEKCHQHQGLSRRASFRSMLSTSGVHHHFASLTLESENNDKAQRLTSFNLRNVSAHLLVLFHQYITAWSSYNEEICTAYLQRLKTPAIVQNLQLSDRLGQWVVVRNVLKFSWSIAINKTDWVVDLFVVFVSLQTIQSQMNEEKSFLWSMFFPWYLGAISEKIKCKHTQHH